MEILRGGQKPEWNCIPNEEIASIRTGRNVVSDFLAKVTFMCTLFIICGRLDSFSIYRKTGQEPDDVSEVVC